MFFLLFFFCFSILIYGQDCSDLATLSIEVEGDWEGERSFKVHPPQGVYVAEDNSIFSSNNDSNFVSLRAPNNGCIRGTYEFTYSYKSYGVIDSEYKSYNGSFYLDGDHNSYRIVIYEGWGDPSIHIYKW